MNVMKTQSLAWSIVDHTVRFVGHTTVDVAGVVSGALDDRTTVYLAGDVKRYCCFDAVYQPFSEGPFLIGFVDRFAVTEAGEYCRVPLSIYSDTRMGDFTQSSFSIYWPRIVIDKRKFPRGGLDLADQYFAEFRKKRRSKVVWAKEPPRQGLPEAQAATH